MLNIIIYLVLVNRHEIKTIIDNGIDLWGRIFEINIVTCEEPKTFRNLVNNLNKDEPPQDYVKYLTLTYVIFS